VPSDADEPLDVERESRVASARHRLEIVEALLRALDLGLPLFETIESSADRGDARRRLVDPAFGFTVIQAEHILDLTLAQRTRASRGHLVDEAIELRTLIFEA
jgi:DNA gyrase/topoisomerase IV subunit A